MADPVPVFGQGHAVAARVVEVGACADGVVDVVLQLDGGEVEADRGAQGDADGHGDQEVGQDGGPDVGLDHVLGEDVEDTGREGERGKNKLNCAKFFCKLKNYFFAI